MNADNDGAPLDLSAAAGPADLSKRSAVQDARVVILVVSGRDLDASKLAEHLAQASPGAASVAFVSVGEVSSNGTPHVTPFDYAAICMLIRQRFGRHDENDAIAAGVAGDALTGRPGNCAFSASGDIEAARNPLAEPARPLGLQRDERRAARSVTRGSILHGRRESDRRNGTRSVAAPTQSLARRVSDTNCGAARDRRAALAEPIPRMDQNATAMEPETSRTSGAAHIGCNDARLSAHGCDAITVMIASDREGTSLLPCVASEHDIELLGDPVANAAHLHARLKQWRPNLLLLDKALLERFGPRSIRRIQATVPGVRVLLLCDAVCSGLVEEILGNHFHGLLLTECPPDVCVKAIRAVSRGEFWLPRALLVDAISESLQALAPDDAMRTIDRSTADAKATLTRREVQIVEHLRQGLSNKEIGRKLGIKEDTVKKHLQSVFPKLGVHRRAMVVLHQGARPSNDT